MAYPTEARRRVDQRDQHPNRYNAPAALAGALVLTWLDSEVQVLDAGGGNRAVTLPTATVADAGMRFVISNRGAANNLVINSTLITLTPGDWAEVFVSDAGAWTVAINYVAA